MSEAVFPLHISQALDRLTVPKVPLGFSDRLAARIASGDLPDGVNVTDTTFPVLRRPIGATGWRRSGRIFVVAATFGLATATAAAAGVFGDPIYIPVVSQALAKAQIVEIPNEKPLADQQATDDETPDAPVTLPITPPASGKDAVLALIAQLRADPAYRDLPRRERLDHFKVEIDQLLADGTAQKGDVKAAWAQLATERKTANQARLDQGLSAPERRKVEAKPLTPEQKEEVRFAVSQLTNEQRAELRLLRQRRREATLQERRAVQSEIRAFWQRVGVKPTAQGTGSITP